MNRFRVRLVENQEWITGTDGFQELTSKNKTEAIIFEDYERKHWQDHKDFEIVDIHEDEIMTMLGMPRLPGF